MTNLNTAVAITESVAAVTEENTMVTNTDTQEVTATVTTKAKSARKQAREAGVKAPKSRAQSGELLSKKDSTKNASVKAPKIEEPIAEAVILPKAEAPKVQPKLGAPRVIVPMSEILSRKGRLIGSDDLQAVADFCRFGEEGGLEGRDLTVAKGLVLTCEKAIKLAAEGQHSEASKVAFSADYVLSRNNRVAFSKVECRDGNVRPIIGILSHYAKTQKRIGAEVEAAKQSEQDSDARTEAYMSLKQAGLTSLWPELSKLPISECLDAVEKAINPAEAEIAKVG